MKKIALVGSLLLLFTHAVPASAAQSTLQVSTYFTAKFDNQIKYKGQDCLKIKFTYKGWSGLSYPAQFSSIGLFKLNGDDAGGNLIFKIGDTYGLGQGDDPFSGAKYMTRCQSVTSQLVDPDCDEAYEESVGSQCEYEDFGGTKPGKYYLQASVTQIKPNFVMKSSKKVFVTITK